MSGRRTHRRIGAAVVFVLLTLPAEAAVSAARPVARGPGVAPRALDPVIVAAGDIACDPTSPYFQGGAGTGEWCRASKTAAVISRIAPTAVLTLGDAQYEAGTLHQYDASYALSWGQFLPMSYPAPGNHDYLSSSTARGYFGYFGARAVPAGASTLGFYSYDIGAWHLISLNSNCGYVQCSAGSAQYRWLKADLLANQQACTLAYWHAPRYSSGPHGDYTGVQPFWNLLYRAGADVVLNGHDHIYERFASQNALGAKDLAFGIREFVVGTGGAQHYWVQSVQPHSVVRDAKTFGVLRMTLHADGYDWRFAGVKGSRFTDAGTGVCHAPPV